MAVTKSNPYTKPIPTMSCAKSYKPSLGDLPMDVIQFEIFPYLDGISCLQANDIFRGDLDYRCPNKIPKDVILKHQMYMASLYLTASTKRQGLRSGSTALPSESIINIFKELLSGKYDILLERNRNFRRVIDNKIADFSNPDSPQYQDVSHGWKKGVLTLAQRLRDKLSTIANLPTITAEPILYYEGEAKIIRNRRTIIIQYN
jgi:hypothetical protein